MIKAARKPIEVFGCGIWELAAPEALEARLLRASMADSADITTVVFRALIVKQCVLGNVRITCIAPATDAEFYDNLAYYGARVLEEDVPQLNEGARRLLVEYVGALIQRKTPRVLSEEEIKFLAL